MRQVFIFVLVEAKTAELQFTSPNDPFSYVGPGYLAKFDGTTFALLKKIKVDSSPLVGIELSRGRGLVLLLLLRI
jgi:hypothetical protein